MKDFDKENEVAILRVEIRTWFKDNNGFIHDGFIQRSIFYNYISNKSSFGHCWHKKDFYFHKQIKSTIFDILCFVCAFVYILKRWQAYLQKWFLNACGYFWFITWWHVKKSSKKLFPHLFVLKRVKFCVLPLEQMCHHINSNCSSYLQPNE